MTNKMEEFIFHLDVIAPKDLELIPAVYLHPKLRQGFEERNCVNIFTSRTKPYLYGFNMDNECVRCDSIYD
jgi:hypothetical protein